MINPDLQKYIQSARDHKFSDQEIKLQLQKTGWPNHEIDIALGNTPSSQVNLPAPPVPRFSSWVTFQYFILFITLYISAVSLAIILHNAIDRLLPNPGVDLKTFSQSSQTLMKYCVSGIIVTYPIFVFFYFKLTKLVSENPLIKSMANRKNLIYLTMGVTFLIMLFHLFQTVYGFLDGNGTLNSLGHFGVTLFVAGSMFFYLVHEVKEDRKSL